MEAERSGRLVERRRRLEGNLIPTFQTQMINFAQAHDAPVSKVCWAHPEYGTIIASSSFDRTVKIWEKASSSSNLDTAVNGSTLQPTQSRWVERAMLPDAKSSVRAAEFAPHQIGLKLVRPI